MEAQASMGNSALPGNVVLMENLSSFENFLHDGQEPRQVLKNITLHINKEEVWGVTGTSLYEVKLLLEIMANLRPYESGRCVLVERGMMRLKRVILKHVFYIGSSEMMYNTMNVLEFLMLATAQDKKDPVERQEEIFERLIKVGLGHISLTSIGLLTKEEKAVVILVAAAYSEAAMIVFNLPEYEFDPKLIDALAHIAHFIRERGKTLILATPICSLLEKACTHMAVLAEGNVIYQGLVEDFRHEYDKVAVIARDQDLDTTMANLRKLFPSHLLVVNHDCLLIREEGAANRDRAEIYQKIIDSGYIPQSLEKNCKKVEYALEELMKQYDLSK